MSFIKNNLISDPLCTVADMVKSDYRTAMVFRKNDINYCCSVKLTIADACTAGNINYNQLLSDLEKATVNIYLSDSSQLYQWKIDFIIEYLVNVHHAYIKKVIPEISSELHNLTEKNNKQFPELQEVQKTFKVLSDLLLTHIRIEETILFPYIKQLDSVFTRSESFGQLFVKTLRKPLNMFNEQHTQIDELLSKLKSLTNSYFIPGKSCTNYQILYFKLQEFHNDLIQHKYIESKILFIRATEIEGQLLSH